MIDEQLTPQGAVSAGARNTILLFVGIAIVAAISAAVAILLPRARTVGDKSQAALAPICADSFYVAAAATPTPAPLGCNSPCSVTGGPSCGTGMTCTTVGTGTFCRNPQNPTSTTCTGLSSPTPKPATPAPPIVCVPPPDVDDPPSVVCAPSTSTKGNITWEWAPAPTANRYWIDVLNSSGRVVTGLPGTGFWRTDTDFNCQTGSCTITTMLPPGTYQSRIRGHAAVGSGAPVCTAASWSYSQKMTLPVCKDTNPEACSNDPADIVLVLDRSDSMNDLESGQTKLAWAKQAMNSFVDSIAAGKSSGNVRIAVVVFGQRMTGSTATLNTVTVRSLTNSYGAVKTAINSIALTDSGTCIGCGIKQANTLLANTTTARYVVLFSDGGATFSSSGVRENTAAENDAIAQADAGRTKNITYFTAQYDSDGFRSPRGTRVMAGVAGDPARHLYKPTVQQWATTSKEIAALICK